MTRQCARPTCCAIASVTLTYDYGGSTVWLEPLHRESHPMTHDLCLAHGDRLSVPMGWQLHDLRVESVAQAS